MRILVTGATGFIGAHVVSTASQAGHEVVALRRGGRVPRVPMPSEPTWLDRDMAELEPCDLDGLDALIHCAAHTPNCPYDTFEACLHWNAQVPLALLEKARTAGVGRFIMAGSSFEYGRAAERYDRVPPDAPLEPTASYPASKAAASTLFAAWARTHSTRLAILRIFQVYGPGEADTRLWPSIRRAALAGQDFNLNPGKLIRDFIRVENVAASLVAALEGLDLEPGRPEVHNVGTGDGRTLADFAQEWWRHWGASGELKLGAIPYRPGEIMRCVALPSEKLMQMSRSKALFPSLAA